MTAGLAAALVVALVAGLLVLRAGARRRDREVAARVDGIAARLDGGRDVPGRSSTEALARLEAAVEGARSVDEAVESGRLAHALDAIPQGVVLCDEGGQVVHRNVVAATLATGRHGEVLVEAVVAELLAAALAGDPASRTVELYGPPRRTVVVSATPLERDSGRAGAVAVIDDISERRRVEAMRRDFVANISHELKTPIGALGLLAETIVAEDDVQVVRRLAGRMQSESERVARTVDDLLQLSRIEAEESPSREPVPVLLVLAEAADRVHPAAEHKGVRIDLAEPSHRLTVIGDRRQLVSAVYNLLDNAVKYSDRGSVVDVGVGTDGSFVEITVSDQGDGIPSRDLERIFERFYRVDRARSRETGGTGLGLAIVRHVANNHQGDVRVASSEGAGSTFTLRLPIGPGPVAVSDLEAS